MKRQRVYFYRRLGSAVLLISVTAITVLAIANISPDDTGDSLPVETTLVNISTTLPSPDYTTTTLADLDITTTLPNEISTISVFGDSLSMGLSRLLVPDLIGLGFTVYKNEHGSSGLTRPDYFDWPNHIEAYLLAENPDIIVISLGANDGQGITIDGIPYSTTNPMWATEYAKRARTVIDLMTAQGRSLIWVGTPDSRPKNFRANLTRIRNIMQTEVATAQARGADVTYIDTWSLFLGEDGNYSPYTIDPRTSKQIKSRDADGFHLLATANRILKDKVLEIVSTIANK